MFHKRTFKVLSSLILLAIFCTGQVSAAPVNSANKKNNALMKPSISTDLNSNSVMFIENVGQMDNGARFQVRGADGTIWLAEDGLWITTLEKTAAPKPPSPTANTDGFLPPSLNGKFAGNDSAPRKGVNIKISFPGANSHPTLEPFNRLDTHVSYFMGNDSAKWHSDVPVWGGVRYKGLYPGIDLEITSENGQIMPRVVARDDANFNAVSLQVNGANGMTLDGNRLLLITAVGKYSLPLLQVNGSNNTNPSNPAVVGNQITFPYGDPKGNAVNVTPLSGASDLLYSTFLGGNYYDDGRNIAVDSSGAAYVTGRTFSSNFPTTPGAFDASFMSLSDIFVVKLNSIGSALIYATFLGGKGYDEEWGLAVDSSGAAYVTGVTTSSDFPTTVGAFDTSISGSYGDAFVAKLNTDGSALIYATFLGGSSSGNAGKSIAVDSRGAAYVTGSTESSKFPTTPGAFDRNFNGGNTDVFVAKLNATGSALIYATFLGGSDIDEGNAIAISSGGVVYITGYTRSSNFPTTPGAFNTKYNGGLYDAFVTKLNATGSALTYSTFLGGNGWDGDFGNDITIDSSGVAYVTGYTDSSNFPTTPKAFNKSFNGGSYDAFVVKLNTNGSALTYSTFLGGNGSDRGWGITIDSSRAAYVTGDIELDPSYFPITPGAFDKSFNGKMDAFVARLNPTGSALTYATFLGGSEIDSSHDIAVDSNGAAYVTGWTYSSNFPKTLGAFDGSSNGYDDAFVAKLKMTTPGTMTFESAGIQDGWILALNNKNTQGGIMNSTSTTFRLGDDAAKKQYRSVLSFNTSGLPDTAVITSVTLKIKQQSITGNATFNMFQGLLVDIRKGTFGTSALQVTDFQTIASKTGIGPFTAPAVSGWYTFNLTSAKAYINKLATLSGLTQFRLRFKLDDNNNAIANYISFFSGNNTTNKPILTIQYYVP